MRLALLVALAAWPAAAATLVVGNKGEDTVSLIDLASGRERARLATGPQPHEVAISPDGRFAAVVAYGGDSLGVVDLVGRTVARTLPLGAKRPHGLVWLPDGRLVATAEGDDALAVVARADGAVRLIPTGAKGSHMVAASGDRAWVANMGLGTVGLFDLAAGRKLGEAKAGVEPEGLALTPDGRELWVADRRSDRVAVFEAATLRPLATVAVGRFPIRVAVSPDGRWAVTSNHRGGDLTVIDVARRAVARTIAVSGRAEAAQVTLLFNPDASRLYVAETGDDRVAELDWPSGRVLRRLAAGDGGDGLGIAPVDVPPR